MQTWMGGWAAVALLAGVASADLYELRVEGTTFAFGNLPAVSVVNSVIFDSATVPITTVSSNVTTSTFSIVSQTIIFDGQTLGITNTPEIWITNTVPGFFDNPDQFTVYSTLSGNVAGVPMFEYTIYAFDYGFGAIDNTDLPLHESYFDQFTGGVGGLISQIGYDNDGQNYYTYLTDQVVTIRRIPSPSGAGLLVMAGLAALRRRR